MFYLIAILIPILAKIILLIVLVITGFILVRRYFMNGPVNFKKDEVGSEFIVRKLHTLESDNTEPNSATLFCKRNGKEHEFLLPDESKDVKENDQCVLKFVNNKYILEKEGVNANLN